MTDFPKGFSGLREYASSKRNVPSENELQVPLEEAEDMKQEWELIELSKWPTLPMPWSSADEGETWVWGDFFLTFQKKPGMMREVPAGFASGGEKPGPHPMIYHYTMMVFYRLDKNPHGPSHRPVIVISLEQLDYSMARQIYEQQGKDASIFSAEETLGPIMGGLFTKDKRFNLGDFTGEMTPQTVKKYFFENLAKWLGLTGNPKLIGTLDDAHGHPETCMPTKGKGKSGCASVFLAFTVMLSLFVFGLIG